jgi:hypothetical protein
MKVSELKENIRGIIRKKMGEAVIDVPNPATETPQTKKQKIDLARRTTGNKNLGTEKDPVEFIEEEDFLDDDDNTIIEDVEDVDSSDGGDIAKMYDEIYEINANVAPGSRYQIEVRKDGNFIILTQDNGQEIVVNPEDVRDLVKVILKIDNEGN